MKEPRLLRVEAGPEAFAPLLEALAEAGLRAGWLELRAPAPLPPDLALAAGLGVLRAVAVGEGRSAAVKPMAGPPVPRDLLREHFLGCAVVLVRGEVEAPRLVPDAESGEAWSLLPPCGEPRRCSTGGLVALLRRPGGWRRLLAAGDSQGD